MYRTFAFLILIILLFAFTLAFAVENVQQKTEGDQSPTINAQNSEIKVTYNNQFNSMIEQTFIQIQDLQNKCFETIINLQNEKLEELNEEMSKIIAQNSDFSGDSAKNWAEKFIQKAPTYKNEINKRKEFREKYNTEFSKNLIGKVYKLFLYILSEVDSKGVSLKEVNQNIKYEKNEYIKLFKDKSLPNEMLRLRNILFENGSMVSISLSPGILNQGLVESCPTLLFIEKNHQTKMQTFRIKPRTGDTTVFIMGGGMPYKKQDKIDDISYRIDQETFLTDNFKKKLDINFTKFLKNAFIRE
jgi:hypothetical protein